jgi:acyl-CoA synthetase (AMP-forming)/AMP-acid ligase II
LRRRSSCSTAWPNARFWACRIPNGAKAGWRWSCRVPGAALDEAALRQHLAGCLAGYKLPRHILFCPALPKTGYGKISKKDLRQDLRARGLLPGE